MRIQQGSIVWVKVKDQAGRNPKCRPAVVVTPSAEIVPGETIVVVAATSSFSRPLPQNQVALPWQHGKHPQTGLYKECIAVCDWLVEIDQSQIVELVGVCPSSTLSAILSKLPTSR